MALASGGTASTRGVREARFWVTAVRLQLFVEVNLVDLEGFYESCRVAELGRLSSGGKNGHENFSQTRIYNYRVVFARNRNFANLTQ